MGAVLPSSAAGKAKAVTEVAKAVDKASDAANAAKKAENVAKSDVKSKAEQLAENKKKGAEWEQNRYEHYTQNEGANLTPQVTVKTDSGTKTRVDFLGTDKNGNPLCIECKSSPTAPLTPNQKKAFPEISESGGTVVGKGTPEFPSGSRLPPTTPKIERPNSKQ